MVHKNLQQQQIKRENVLMCCIFDNDAIVKMIYKMYFVNV